MTNTTQLAHWSQTIDEQNIVWLTFNRQDATMNTINAQVLNELKESIKSLPSTATGLVIQSAKENSFIAGADIHQFVQFRDIKEAQELLLLGHEVFDLLESVTVPTVALIDGCCLGGGLELALACDYRIVSDAKKTKLGLPEVKLGIIPGWGGSVRLPRKIGALKGLDLILKGKVIPGKVAKKLGLADSCVAPYHLTRAATQFILKAPKKYTPGFADKCINLPFVRPLIAKQMKKAVSKHVRIEHYPAPFAAIDNWKKTGSKGCEAFEAEKKAAGELFVTDTSKNLVRLFFLQDRLKNLGEKEKFKFKHVHVVGAGAMGAGIATVAAHAGCTVTLQDREAKFIAPAYAHAAKTLKRLNRDKRDYQAAMDRFIPDPNGYGIATADIIIEAIFEDVKVKQNLFKDLEKIAKPDAILASNTSSIPLDSINKVMQQPERLVGIHFFNPVDKMQLVEVVHSPTTSQEVVNGAIAFIHHINKLPLPVKSKPGFLINRILMPYLLESVTLVESGIPPEVVDEAALAFGMPMGPVTLADTVGLDICYSVIKILEKPMKITMPDSLAKLVEGGDKGMKTGKGYYQFKNNKPVKNKVDLSQYDLKEIQDRLMFRMINECIACLEENVVEDADLLDIGMIFGTGFAPFRGGPVHYANSLGSSKLKKRFSDLKKVHGERFVLKGKLETIDTLRMTLPPSVGE